MSAQDILTGLLQQNSMTADTLDLGTTTQLFLSQMRVSLYGGAASIPMLPTFLKPIGILSEKTPIAVALLNDKEVCTSLVTFTDGKPLVTDGDRFPIPGREYPAPLSDILYAVAELLEPLLPHAKRVAICLPFPVDYNSKGDGVIRRFPGTMTVTDFKERSILEALAQEFSERACPLLPMTLLNTTTAVMTAGRVTKPEESRYLGLTWGTDLDVAFAAPGSIVLRWKGIPQHLMLFHGGFSSAECVPFGLADAAKDRDSYAPGRDLYLKMAATDYLGDIFRLVMIKAAERKLLSFGCSRDILSLRTLDLKSVIDFLENPETGGTIAHFCREPEDRAMGIQIARAVIDRAARLVCASLSAVLQFSGAGREAPVYVGVEGDAFTFAPLRAALNTHLQTFTKDTLGLSVTLYQESAMSTIGAAALALYNAD